MTYANDPVESLARLAVTDRHWILERLSAEEKTRLALRIGEDNAGEVADEHPSAERMPEQRSVKSSKILDRAVHVLATAQADAVATLLKKEPAWIVAALLGARPWTWHDAVLSALPAEIRYEALRLRRTGFQPGAAVTEALLRVAADKYGDTSGAIPSASRFERTLIRMRHALARKPFFGFGYRA